MKKHEIIVISAIILIGIIIIVGILVAKNSGKNESAGAENTNKEEFTQTLDDGTRLNTSEQMKNVKKIEGLEISDIQVTEKNNVSLILGTVTNVTDTVQGDFPAKVKVVDKNGNEIITIGAYIPKLQPGQSDQFSTNASFDYANGYDFIITRDTDV